MADMPRWFRSILRRAAALAGTALIGGLLTASLVRYSPGFNADERQLDTRIGQETRARISAEHGGDRQVLRFYLDHLRGMLRGNLGVSPSLRQPVTELLVARAPVTLGLMGAGVAGGWLLAFALALPSVMARRQVFSRTAEAINICLLALPSAAIAVFIFAAGGPVYAIIGLVLFPRVYEYTSNLLRDAYSRPHILAARAKGLSPARILLRHVLPVCAPEFLALAGISLTMAFGAAIPVETFCDLPGIGQLAWKAATARDLPLLVTLTMCIAILTQLCLAVSDWAARRFENVRA